MRVCMREQQGVAAGMCICGACLWSRSSLAMSLEFSSRWRSTSSSASCRSRVAVSTSAFISTRCARSRSTCPWGRYGRVTEANQGLDRRACAHGPPPCACPCVRACTCVRARVADLLLEGQGPGAKAGGQSQGPGSRVQGPVARVSVADLLLERGQCERAALCVGGRFLELSERGAQRVDLVVLGHA